MAYATRVLPVLLLALLSACAPLRQAPDLEPAPYLEPASRGVFADWLADVPAAKDGESGFRLLATGTDAYTWRMHSARMARERLRIQYYIWKNDVAGKLLMGELLDAADRGVQVHLLLDDMDVRGDDRSLAALDQHPNVEVRIFNPFRSRGGMVRPWVEFVLSGSDLNHRMHNKIWVADGRLAIIGGRNVGDEYFDAGAVFNFADLDMAMVGPMALQADDAFVDYWNSAAAIPIGQIRRMERDPEKLRRHRAFLRGWLDEQGEHPLLEPANGHRDAGRAVLLDSRAYVWTDRATLVVDDPAKALGRPQPAPGVLEALNERFARVERELVLISPYFIPGADGTETLVSLAERGVHVRVLTNSLAATDVAFAHTGYARRRHALLEGGVEIHELRPMPPSGGDGPDRRFGLGASRASLHTKALVLDGEETFVGSYNLSPRSAHINTELGVFIRDPVLGQQVRELFHQMAQPARSYRLGLDGNSRLHWTDGEGRRHHREPEVGFWRRFLTRLTRLLPVESQL